MKENHTICVEPEVWEMLKELASKNFTSISGMIQQLAIKEYEKEIENG